VDCIRRAWLTLGDRILPLEDTAAGYACTELDLGYPDVRDSATVNNRPDQDGVDDRTKYAGARAMSADIRAVGGSMTVDEIGALFAVYQIPNARPQLHYILDRPGAPERFTTVRATGYGWPISGARHREIHLSWLASDPFMYDPSRRVAVSLAGSSTIPGRRYPLTFDRIYPIGGGVPSTGEIRSPGDIVVRPLLRIFGPITDPLVEMTPTSGADPAGPPALIQFVAGFIIPAGSFVDVDTQAKTAFLNGDNAQSEMAQIDWAQSVWPVLPTLPYWSWLTLRGDSTSATTQVQALWYDGFLT
jgi:hypothetical protein